MNTACLPFRANSIPIKLPAALRVWTLHSMLSSHCLCCAAFCAEQLERAKDPGDSTGVHDAADADAEVSSLDPKRVHALPHALYTLSNLATGSDELKASVMRASVVKLLPACMRYNGSSDEVSREVCTGTHTDACAAVQVKPGVWHRQ
jgi:hypothetical protein